MALALLVATCFAAAAFPPTLFGVLPAFFLTMSAHRVRFLADRPTVRGVLPLADALGVALGVAFGVAAFSAILTERAARKKQTMKEAHHNRYSENILTSASRVHFHALGGHVGTD